MTFLAIVIVAYVLGRWMLWPLRGAPPVERAALRLSAGLAVTGLLLAVAGLASLRFAQGLLLTLGVIGLAAELFLFRMRDRLETVVERDPWRPVEGLLAAVAGLALLACLVPAFTPIAEADLIATQAGPLAELARQGRLPWMGVRETGEGFLPRACYASAFAGGDERSLRLMGWLWAPLLASACMAAGRRLAGREAGLWAAAFAATAPVVLTQSRLLQPNLPLAALFVSAAAALLAWREEGGYAQLAAGGFLAGVCCGAGAEAYVLAPILWVAVMAACLPGRRRAAVLFTLSLLAGAAPWAIQYVLAHHSPLESLRLRDLTPRAILLFPWQAVMMPARFGGWEQSPGPWALLLGLLGLAAGPRRIREPALVAILAGAALFPFRGEPQAFLPLFALMLPVAGAAVARLRALRPLTAGAAGLGVLLLTGLAYVRIAEAIPPALGLQRPGEYIQQQHPYYGVYQWLGENVPPEHRIGLVTPSAYFLNGRGAYLLDELQALTGKKLPDQASWLRARRIRYVVFPHDLLYEQDRLRDVYYMMRRWENGNRHFTVLRSFAVPQTKEGDEDERVDVIGVRFVGP